MANPIKHVVNQGHFEYGKEVLTFTLQTKCALFLLHRENTKHRRPDYNNKRIKNLESELLDELTPLKQYDQHEGRLNIIENDEEKNAMYNAAFSYLKEHGLLEDSDELDVNDLTKLLNERMDHAEASIQRQKRLLQVTQEAHREIEKNRVEAINDDLSPKEAKKIEKKATEEKYSIFNSFHQATGEVDLNIFALRKYNEIISEYNKNEDENKIKKIEEKSFEEYDKIVDIANSEISKDENIQLTQEAKQLTAQKRQNFNKMSLTMVFAIGVTLFMVFGTALVIAADQFNIDLFNNDGTVSREGKQDLSSKINDGLGGEREVANERTDYQLERETTTSEASLDAPRSGATGYGNSGVGTTTAETTRNVNDGARSAAQARLGALVGTLGVFSMGGAFLIREMSQKPDERIANKVNHSQTVKEFEKNMKLDEVKEEEKSSEQDLEQNTHRAKLTRKASFIERTPSGESQSSGIA